MEEIVSLLFARDIVRIKEAITSEKFKINDFISRERSALALAAARGYMDVMNCLIDQGADVNLNNAGDFGYTPLEIAAREGQLEAVQLLLSRGASIDKGNAINSSALIGVHQCK